MSPQGQCHSYLEMAVMVVASRLFRCLEQVEIDCIADELGCGCTLLCGDAFETGDLIGGEPDADGRISLGRHIYHPHPPLYAGDIHPSRGAYPQTGKIWTYTEAGPPGARQRSRGPGRSRAPVEPRPPLRVVTPLAAGPDAAAVALRARGAVVVALGCRPGLPPPLRGPADRERGWMAPRPPGAVTDTPGHTEIAVGGPGRIPRESGKGPPHRGDRRPR